MPFVFDNPNHHGSGFYFDDPSETSSGSGGGTGFSGDLGVNMTTQSLLVKQNWTKAGNAYVGDQPAFSNLAMPLSGWTIGTNPNGTLAIATTDETDDTFDGSATNAVDGTAVGAEFGGGGGGGGGRGGGGGVC